MASSAAVQSEPASILACTVARDIRKFDLLIEDMETELGESWGDLTIPDAHIFFDQPEAEALEFIAIAIDQSDESHLAAVGNLISTAKKKGIKVILIAEDVSPVALHQLLKLGAREFVPYPLPDGALHDAIERLRAPEPANTPSGPIAARDSHSGKRNGVIVAVQGLAGGVGATTIASNIAWELANIEKEAPPKVLIMDLDLQFGSVATFLDLARSETVYELLSDMSVVDNDAFLQALASHEEKLHVLTAPADILPLDLIGPEDVEILLEFARTNFDYVVIDMPKTIVQWTETVLTAAHVYITPLELDMRSAQNTLRMARALKSEELPYEKLRFLLNRAPKFTDLSGKSRIKRMSESLDIKIELMMPDGGKPVAQACDQGEPLAASNPKNPLRKEIVKLAASIHEHNQAEAAAE